MRQAFLLVTLLSLGCATATTTDTMDTGTGMMLTDADIVQIVTLINRGEVDQGQLAQTRASASDVRDFASMMVRDHQDALSRLQGGAMPAAGGGGETARLLESAAAATLAALRTYSSADFDRAYMQSQVDQHRWALSALDQSLIPGARDSDLRNLLQNMRGTVAAHLNRAQQLAR